MSSIRFSKKQISLEDGLWTCSKLLFNKNNYCFQDSNCCFCFKHKSKSKQTDFCDELNYAEKKRFGGKAFFSRKNNVQERGGGVQCHMKGGKCVSIMLDCFIVRCWWHCTLVYMWEFAYPLEQLHFNKGSNSQGRPQFSKSHDTTADQSRRTIGGPPFAPWTKICVLGRFSLLHI